MKCYNHHDRDAFGICKACGKALCLECMKEENGVIVCNNSLNCLKILDRCRIGFWVGIILLAIILLLLIL